ncbi:type I secretion system permease/ATPase [Hydrogenophaga sp.]|uniref:type I secretion system permease/ATPase n=1 Tax=Hydrogenophaga sp. TaxID=1904254 RepID=UPI003919FD86
MGHTATPVVAQTTADPTTPDAPPRLDFELALALCAALCGRPTSPISLGAGLPREGQRLSPEAHERAAERAQLDLQAMPAEALLAKHRAGELVIVPNGERFDVIRQQQGAAQRLPALGQGPLVPEPLDDAALQAALAGGGWAVRPRHLNRAADTELPPVVDRYGWLRRAVLAQWPTLAWVALSSLVANGLVILSSFYSMQVYDRVVPNNAYETLWALSVGVTLIYVFDTVMRILRAYMLDVAGKRVDFAISSRLFEQVLGLKMAQRPASAGVFANHLNDFESIRDFFTSLTLTVVIDFPFVLLYLAAIAFMAGSLVWVPLLLMPVMLGIAIALQGPVDRAVRTSMQASAQKHGMVIEVLAGIEALKLSAAEGVFQGAWERAVRQIADASMRSKLLSSAGLSVVNFMQSMAGVAVLIAGVYAIGAGQLTMGGLIAASMLVSRALAPIGQLASLLSRWKQTRQSMDTVARIFERPVERPADKTFLVRERLDGAIEFQGVGFQYPGAPGPALVDVSLRIQPGERVAVIGRSGSGKSTLMKLISGLYEPSQGSVLVGGVDTRQLDPHQLRRAMGCVPQDPFLFNGSVRDNIAYGDDAVGDARLVQAATEAGVDEFVRTHPKGYDLPVGERGALLSGGQRQAVALARALVGQRAMLLMDEPSSSLDHVAEQFLRRRLLQRRPGETLLIITHRLPMLELVDRVIVLHEGRVQLDGPRQAVLQKLQAAATSGDPT